MIIQAVSNLFNWLIKRETPAVVSEPNPVTKVQPPEVAPPAAKPTTLVDRIVLAMQKHKYQLDTDPDTVNIIYVEGLNPDGTANDNRSNQFNDLRTVIGLRSGKWVLLGAWDGTTEPSRKWTETPMNSGGAARIAFGQYRAWSLGMHHTHEALVQTAEITVYRDKNKDYKREGDKTDTGLFGINQHWGYDLPKTDMANSSAGCLVGRTTAGHKEFMSIVKSDPRFQKNHRYEFLTTVMPAAWLS